MRRHLAWLLMSGVVVACSDDVEPDTDTGQIPAEERARLRFLHLSPDAPAVDMYVRGNLEIEDLTFTEGTGYVQVLAGDARFRVVPANEDIAQAVLDTSLQLVAEQSYTAVAWDRLGDVRAALVPDSIANLASGETRLQFVHAASDFGEVDIWTAGSPPTPLIQDLAPGAFASIDDMGDAMTIAIDADDDGVGDARFALPDFDASGQLVNLYVTNDDAGSPFLVAHLPDGTTQRIDPEPDAGRAEARVLHLVPDAGAVDVWFGAEAAPTLTDVTFGIGMTYADVAAGMQSIAITPPDQPRSAALATVSVDLMENKDWSIVPYGMASAIQVLLLDDDRTLIPTGQARLQLAHVAAGVGQVDVYLLDGANQLLLENVDYGAHQHFDVPPGTYDIGLDVNDDTIIDLRFDDVGPTQAGALVNVYAVQQSGDVFLLAQGAGADVQRIDAED